MIDSLRKRSSVIGYGLPAGRVLPIPDGTVTLGDRAQVVGLYRFADQQNLTVSAAVSSQTATGAAIIGYLCRLIVSLLAQTGSATASVSVQRKMIGGPTAGSATNLSTLGLIRSISLLLSTQSNTVIAGISIQRRLIGSLIAGSTTSLLALGVGRVTVLTILSQSNTPSALVAVQRKVTGDVQVASVTPLFNLRKQISIIATYSLGTSTPVASIYSLRQLVAFGLIGIVTPNNQTMWVRRRIMSDEEIISLCPEVILSVDGKPVARGTVRIRFRNR